MGPRQGGASCKEKDAWQYFRGEQLQRRRGTTAKQSSCHMEGNVSGERVASLCTGLLGQGFATPAAATKSSQDMLSSALSPCPVHFSAQLAPTVTYPLGLIIRLLSPPKSGLSPRESVPFNTYTYKSIDIYIYACLYICIDFCSVAGVDAVCVAVR